MERVLPMGKKIENAGHTIVFNFKTNNCHVKDGDWQDNIRAYYYRDFIKTYFGGGNE